MGWSRNQERWIDRILTGRGCDGWRTAVWGYGRLFVCYGYPSGATRCVSFEDDDGENPIESFGMVKSGNSKKGEHLQNKKYL